MILAKEKYQKTVKRPYPPLLGSLVLTGITDEKVYAPFFSQSYARKDSLLCDGVWYNNAEAEDLGRQLIAKEWTSSEAIEKFSGIIKEREKLLLKSVTKPFKKFSEAFENYMAALTLVFLAEQPFYDKLKNSLLSRVSQEETKKILEILNVPLEDNYYKKEEFDLVSSTNLERHAKEYEWFFSRNGRDITYTIENAKTKLAEIDKKKFLREYLKNKEEIRNTTLKAKKIIGKPNAYLVDGLQFIVFYRTHRTDVISRAIYLHIPKLKSIAREASVNYEDILFCLEAEILGKNIPSKKIIDERKKGYAIASIDNKIICFVGKELAALKAKLEDKVEYTKEIKGESASRGVVSGKVKIVNNQNDFAKIKEGDVLVTSMTTPEMIPIMKLAVAFVTDEGGITCHAAIVAREMKKPCVIGTKMATKMLRDGDRVQVNAGEGTVTIL